MCFLNCTPIGPTGGVIIEMKIQPNSSNNLEFLGLLSSLSPILHLARRLLQLICDYAFDLNCRGATEMANAGEMTVESTGSVHVCRFYCCCLVFIFFGGLAIN